MATFKDKLSSLIGSQVPDFVLDDHPKFLQFLKTYYAFMEAAELSVTSVQTTEGVQLETETGQDNKLILDGSRIDSDITPLDEGDKILLEVLLSVNLPEEKLYKAKHQRPLQQYLQKI